MPASTRGAKRPRSGSDIVTSPSARIVLAVLRIAVGFIFLWTFLDKTFGLGFSTPRQMAWIHGGQPAQGFIKGVAFTAPSGVPSSCWPTRSGTGCSWLGCSGWALP